MLYDYMIIYDYKTEGKKERNTTACHWLVLPLKGHLCTLFAEKKVMCTFLSISYKDVFIRVLLFTYFKLYFVCIVCTVHGTQ